VNGAREAVHVIFRGRVQGVGFRAWLAQHADSRRIDGWVCNRPDGSVEALLAGPPAAIQQILAVCRDGSPAAVITDVICLPQAEDADPGFRIRA
jgi:acylphosphatase